MATFYTDTASIEILSVTNLTAQTSSIQYYTSSQFDIGTNLITLNTNLTPLRYGGIAVADSGSSPITSGSLLFDSQNNQWIFIHQQTSGGPITSSVLIMGPQTFNDIGNETTIIANRLTKGQSGDLGEHITSSNVTDTGTLVSINSNTEVTGSFIVTGGITGSLLGTASTASFIQTAQTASYVLQAISSSFASTASNITPVITNDAADRMLTANGDGTLNAESNLTFDGSNLKLTGSLHVTGSVDATIFTNTTKISGSSSGAAGNYITTQFLGSDVNNSTTTLATAMTTTGVGPGLYQFKYVVRYQSAATTTGIGLAVDHTQTTNYFVSSYWFISTGGAAATGVADQVAATNAGQMAEGKSERVKGTVSSATAGVDTQNADMLAVVEGLIDVTANGDLLLEFRSEVATSQVTIKSGTSLILTKMS